MSDTDQAQTEYEFKAQVQQVLSLVINSLYTNSEIFLRELISNASDALDKGRYLSLTRDEVREIEGELQITITLDEEAKTLTIEDNGIGMTREEVIENLGTIARSGTAEFLAKYTELAKRKDDSSKEAAMELIGQFGVGFYSTFMVASRVDVHTLSMLPDSEPVLWRSSGEGSFIVVEGDRKAPGTKIVVHLKDDSGEFAYRWRVENIVKKYSDFVMFPIRVGDDVANRSAALWRLPKSQITDDDHAEFFKHVTGGRLGDKPIDTIHYQIDAPVQFTALIYIPEKSTPDLYILQNERPGLKLYARRVLIMENCESLTPGYLRFCRGVVDSEDLTLNVSRETLQEDRVVQQIQQQLTKQILKSLQSMADEKADDYAAFWKEFGQVFKEGLSTDWKNKDTLAKLCRFQSLNTPGGKFISLDQYLENKPESQKAIYYLTGTGRQQVERSPALEIFRKKGIDVLLLCDPIDEWVVKSLPEYEKVSLKSIVHGELDLGEERSEKEDEQGSEGAEDTPPENIKTVIEAVKSALGDRVEDVRPSNRLTETVSCLVSKDGAPGANFERMMKMLDTSAVEQKRILEINPTHPFVINLGKLVERDPQSSRIQIYSEMLYDQALLSEGVVEDPGKLVKRIQDLLVESSTHAVGD